jgi:outer membrane protein OmpA-like peptidoglycan-associated protein
MNTRKMVAVPIVALLVLLNAGCATKKFVRTNVDNLENKISGVDKKYDQKTGELSTNITDLDRKTEAGIADAQKKGADAAQQASKAGNDAQAANTLAQKGVDDANRVGQQLENADNFQPVKSEMVLFKFNHSDLTTEDKEQLDTLAQSVAGMKHYVIEVTGYTDKVGDPQYNLELSRRRADTVARYLTENGKIPLVRIRYLGYGEDMPAGDNKSREGRKQNRRVEVKVMAPPMTAQASNMQVSTAPVTQ